MQFHLLFNDKGNKHKAYWGGRGRRETEADELNEAENVCRSRVEKLKSKHFKKFTRHTGTGWNVGTQGTRLKEQEDKTCT